jgi:hypothetical protein
MMLRCLLLCAMIVLSSAVQAGEPVIDAEIVIYGGTSAGVIAAVQAVQMGKSVIIVSPDKHLGGLSSGGLGYTDSGKKEAIGGLSREFYHRVWKHYQSDAAWNWEPRNPKLMKSSQGGNNESGSTRAMWLFEPHVAERIFDEFIAENQIPVHRNEWLDRESGLVKDGSRIVSFSTLSGKTYRGKIFIDATYEGDLMAAAGVSYHVGREANSVYKEKWNGVQKDARHHGHLFAVRVDPFVIPGDRQSGLLPRISADPPGENGAGDNKIQAYCFRMCLTNKPENRVSFPRPEGYDPAQYELLVRVFATGWREVFHKFDAVPNRKTDTNNHGPFSTDNIGFNYDYPEGSYERRREIIAEHETYQQGLMYFLANDPRVPEDVRQKMSQWGLPKDEFQDNGHWPHQIYVREARRMIGEYVMTEHDCLDEVVTPQSVGMGSYTIDSHNVQRYVTSDGAVQNEGDVGVHTPRPYEIAYGALVPRKGQCPNLIVPVCCSSSHIAYGSIRMEPVFMILGQSAATAAAMAIDLRLPVQEIPYPELAARLKADGQILELVDPAMAAMAKLKGVLVDDEHAKFTGEWGQSSAIQTFLGRGYHHDQNAHKGLCTARFEAKLPPGRYDVRVSYVPSGNRATNVPVNVEHSGNVATLVLNQREPIPSGEVDVSLGRFDFNGRGAVVVSNTGTDGYVVVDTVRFVPEK